MREQEGKVALSDEEEPAEEFVSACYLCHGQCARLAGAGKGLRSCARGVSEIIQRSQQRRRQARAAR